MGVIALLAGGLLLAGAIGSYRVFSYLAALFIVGVIGAASIERNDSEFDLAPYSRLLVGFTATFGIGLTGIWLLWHPGTTEYTYLLGLPTSTLIYVVFIWLLPILGAVYYALVFQSIGDEQVVDGILRDVRAVQRNEEYPLSPDEIRQPEGRSPSPSPSPAETDSDGNSGGDTR